MLPLENLPVFASTPLCFSSPSPSSASLSVLWDSDNKVGPSEVLCRDRVPPFVSLQVDFSPLPVWALVQKKMCLNLCNLKSSV